MSLAQKIRMLTTYAGISEAEMARRLETTPQAWGQRLKTDKFSQADLDRVAAAVGARCEIRFIMPNGDVI